MIHHLPTADSAADFNTTLCTYFPLWTTALRNGLSCFCSCLVGTVPSVSVAAMAFLRQQREAAVTCRILREIARRRQPRATAHRCSLFGGVGTIIVCVWGLSEVLWTAAKEHGLTVRVSELAQTCESTAECKLPAGDAVRCLPWNSTPSRAR